MRLKEAPFGSVPRFLDSTWRDGAATFVVAAIPDLKRGKHVVEAKFG